MVNGYIRFTPDSLAEMIRACGEELIKEAEQLATGGEDVSECTIYIQLRSDELPSMSVTLERDRLIPSAPSKCWNGEMCKAFEEGQDD